MSVDTAVAVPVAVPLAVPVAVAQQQLIVATVMPTRGLLGRVAAVLSPHCVTSLSYRTPPSGPATVEVIVPTSEAARVRAKLLRMVDVLDARCVADL
ncbi:hypothetical protein ABIA32_006512 [Streptacidiphilus sp. MAP12-20]|uniref:hypothetical protein n=1 Tax=Streptacidiphilus sp. MAP12-20 TaxID=3156299 RepID=UPI00351859AD